MAHFSTNVLFLDETAARAAREVDNVPRFVRWNVDRVIVTADESPPSQYNDGVEHLVDLFRTLMPPMEVLMNGQTLDLEMHDRALAILWRMEAVLGGLAAFDPQ